MFKHAIGLLVVCGFAVSSPVNRPSPSGSDNIHRLLELSPDDAQLNVVPEDSIREIGVTKRTYGVAHPEHFFEPTGLGHHRPQHVSHDPYVGSEEAAIRAANNPLFFEEMTPHTEHMMNSYAERRHQLDGTTYRFRSIRPDYPYSDLPRRRSARFARF